MVGEAALFQQFYQELGNHQLNKMESVECVLDDENYPVFEHYRLTHRKDKNISFDLEVKIQGGEFSMLLLLKKEKAFFDSESIEYLEYKKLMTFVLERSEPAIQPDQMRYFGYFELNDGESFVSARLNMIITSQTIGGLDYLILELDESPLLENQQYPFSPKRIDLGTDKLDDYLAGFVFANPLTPEQLSKMNQNPRQHW